MEETVKYYSLEEVAKNDGKNGSRIWIAYKNIVYDVTDYVDEHPGGAELVTDWAGMECTKAFDDAGHSSDAKKDLKQYKIGEIREEDRKQKQKKKENGVTEIKDKENRRSFCSYLTCGVVG